MRKILIIGGGAAGYFAAIHAAENNKNAQVFLVESGKDPLRKVRISGGGRCNVTHNCFEPRELIKNYPRGSRELLSLFTRFQPKDTMEWFKNRGVELKIEEDGRIFPTSDNSQTIIDCLEKSASSAKIKIFLETKVNAIERLEPSTAEELRFQVQFASQYSLENQFHSILLATGSTAFSYTLAKNLGHTITPLAPSLFTFKIKDSRLENLSGISFPKVRALLECGEKKFEQEGPCLITHWGLSGPAVLKLSAFAARELQAEKYQAKLQLNFLPEHTQETLLSILQAQKESTPKKKITNANPFHLPERFWLQLLNFLEIDLETQWATLSKKNIQAILDGLSRAHFSVNGKGEFKDEFVTCGGISLKEISFPTMESKLVPGLFFAGEILDIDGITGGFNFQNAWTTAWHAAKYL